VGKLSPLVGTEFQLTEISGRALDAAAGWKSVYYDWPTVLRKFGEPDRLDLALWAGERLLALGLATTRTNALWIELIEGNPDRSSPVTGARLVILFDAFANYAQLRSKPELRLEAKNPGLAALYENAYGFERVLSTANALYWRRRV
jgi:hypothetical protein